MAQPPLQSETDIVATGLRYWEWRANEYGHLSVLNLGHGADSVEGVTCAQRELVMPFFRSLLRGDERVVLDFGCGTGRFTACLAETIHGRAIGVDPTTALIKLAPCGSRVEYVTSNGRTIPLPDASVDIVWVCLVLGGLPDPQLPATIGELNRVMRPEGLFFLVENTSAKESCPHWAFRSVAEYQRLFQFASLVHLHDYDDLGERISVLAGRKTTISS